MTGFCKAFVLRSIHNMHFTLVKFDKTYEAATLILLACTIPCAFLVSQSTSLDPNMVLLAAPFCLALVAFIFLLHPPQDQLTLFAISIEWAILNVVLVVNNFPDCRKLSLSPLLCNTIFIDMSGQFAIFIMIGSYIICNLLLGALMSIQGLSLKDMGIMGRPYLAIGAAWNAGCIELRGGNTQSVYVPHHTM